MHLAYSAIDINTTNTVQKNNTQQRAANHELTIRYQAYQAACNKFSREITAIQKYLPGWTPKFSY